MSDDLGRERRAFAATVIELGPDALSACGTWTAGALAIHVVTGELGAALAVAPARWLVGHGVRVDRLAPLGERTLGSLSRRHDVGWALDRLDRRPPWLHRHGTVGAVSLLEVWAHHEDLVIANDLDACASGIDLTPVMTVLARYQRGLLKTHGVRVSSAGTVWHEPQATARVLVDGPLDELARWLAGRAGLDALDVSGDPGSAARLASDRPRL